MLARLIIVPVLFIAVGLAMALSGLRDEPLFTSEFGLEASPVLLPDGGNQFLSLTPGTFYRYEGGDEDEFIEMQVTVLDRTRPVAFQSRGETRIALTRVVEEREWINGVLSEVSLNYYAQSPRSGNVFHFGEEVDVYEEGVIAGHEGTWLAGEEGAEAGLIMPSLFLLGSRYCQAIAPGVAMDRAENVAMGLTVETPAGVFEDCVMTVETNPLDPDEECINIHAPGVGLIVDDSLELVEYGVSNTVHFTSPVAR